jgi:hypothetical protein
MILHAFAFYWAIGGSQNQQAASRCVGRRKRINGGLQHRTDCFASTARRCECCRGAESCRLAIKFDCLVEQLLFTSKRRIEACLRNPQLSAQIRHRNGVVTARPEESHRFLQRLGSIEFARPTSFGTSRTICRSSGLYICLFPVHDVYIYRSVDLEMEALAYSGWRWARFTVRCLSCSKFRFVSSPLIAVHPETFLSHSSRKTTNSSGGRSHILAFVFRYSERTRTLSPREFKTRKASSSVRSSPR